MFEACYVAEDDDGDDDVDDSALDDGFDFAACSCSDDNVAEGCEVAYNVNDDVAVENDCDHPQRDESSGEEAEEDCESEYVVGEWIHQFAEACDDFVFSGDVSVEEVGEFGDDDDGECGDFPYEVFLEEEYEEDGAQENSKYGDGICDVHLETFEK